MPLTHAEATGKQGLPGGPMVKNSPANVRGGVQSPVGDLRSHMPMQATEPTHHDKELCTTVEDPTYCSYDLMQPT